MVVDDASRELFRLLNAAIPGLPENITKMSIKLECGSSPLIECTFIPKTIGGNEAHEQTFLLIAIDGTHNAR